MTDTKNVLIAQRYSQALSDFAQEGKLGYDKINTDLVNIKETLEHSAELKELLTNPLISADDKKEVINQIFSGEVERLILNFLKVLIDKNRFDAFDEIVTSFSENLDKVNNISRIEVVSAITLPEDAKNRLIEKLSYKLGKQVIINNTVDEDIIAGLVIKIGDNIIDTSLRHKLDDLEKHLTK